MRIRIREARIDDISEIIRVERKAWPNGLSATEEKFRARIQTFPEGNLVAIYNNNISGVVATNATTEPRIISKYGSGFSNRGGGLSGDDAEYRRRATDVIAHIYSTTDGQVTIMGVGGVNSTKAALEKIQAGAKIVQIVTGMRSEGPSLPGRINRGLVKWLESNGIDRIESVVGTHTMQGINQV